MSKRQGSIYCITNKVNGKQYIGLTYRTIKKRWAEHVACSKNQRYSHRPLYQDIKQHGKHNFKVTSLGHYLEGELERKERYYIQTYDTQKPNGYNSNAGGSSGGTPSYNFPVDKIIFAYQDGSNLEQVGRKFGCCAATVRAILKRNNIPVRKRPIPLQKTYYLTHFEDTGIFLQIAHKYNWLYRSDLPEPTPFLTLSIGEISHSPIHREDIAHLKIRITIEQK